MTINSSILPTSKILVGVIGGRNYGKSTIIQSLTGCETRSFRGYVEARDSYGNLKRLYVICSSLQEQILKVTPQLQELGRLLTEAFNDPDCNGVVIAIQPSIPRSRVSMEQIYQIAIKTGFNSYGFILNKPYQGQHSNANLIRERLIRQGLTHSNIFELDARKFSILNAEIIRVNSTIIV
jgi:hypothetical protein